MVKSETHLKARNFFCIDLVERVALIFSPGCAIRLKPILQEGSAFLTPQFFVLNSFKKYFYFESI